MTESRHREFQLLRESDVIANNLIMQELICQKEIETLNKEYNELRRKLSELKWDIQGIDEINNRIELNKNELNRLESRRAELFIKLGVEGGDDTEET